MLELSVVHERVGCVPRRACTLVLVVPVESFHVADVLDVLANVVRDGCVVLESVEGVAVVLVSVV